MAIFKKSIIIILCATLAFSPLLYCGDFSYADEDPWSIVTDNSITVLIWNQYAKSRGYETITSPTSIYTEFTYNQLEQLCTSKGITVSELNQNLKYMYNSENHKYTFYLSQAVLRMLNDLYEALLTETGIQPNEFKTIYSGKYYIDNNNNHIICFARVNAYNKYDSWNGVRTNFYNEWTGFGTMYAHKGTQLKDFQTVTYDNLTNYRNETGFTYNIDSATQVNIGSFNGRFYGINTTGNAIYCELGYNSGYDCIIYTPYNDKYYLGTFLDYNKLNRDGSLNSRTINISGIIELKKNNDNNGNANVQGHRGSEQNPYDEDKDYTIDYDPNDQNDDPDPTPVDPPTPPAPPTDPYVTNPTGGNEDENGNFNWKMPDINVDWDLGDFSDIFPFSIPYDIIELFDIVDSEPVTPSIYQEVDFGAFNYTIDFDLSYFDEFMEYVRAMELFLYTLTLFIATRGIFKIY